MFELSVIVIAITYIVLAGGGFLATTSAYCESSRSFTCRNGVSFEYPFYDGGYSANSTDHCGYPGFEINCLPNGRAVINISHNLYYVKKEDNYTANQRLLVYVEVAEEECPRPAHNFTSSTFVHLDRYNVIYFYNCSSGGYPENAAQGLPCLDTYYNNNTTRSFAFKEFSYPQSDEYNWWHENCQENVVVPVGNIYNDSNYSEDLKSGFNVRWYTPDECRSCEGSGGHCLYNQTDGAPLCSCESDTKLYHGTCPSPSPRPSPSPTEVNTSAYCESSSFTCENGVSFEYPFYNGGYSANSTDHCGYPGFEINCLPNGRAVINISHNLYYVKKETNYTANQRLLVYVEVAEEECPRPAHNFTSSTFVHLDRYNVIYFYNCSSGGYPENPAQGLPCLDTYYNNNTTRSFAFKEYSYSQSDEYNWWHENCQENVVVPVSNIYNDSNYSEDLKSGFNVRWNTPDECRSCEGSGGHCLYNQTDGAPPLCACESDTKLYHGTCPSPSPSLSPSPIEGWNTPDECRSCEGSGGHCLYNQTAGAPLCSCESNTKLYHGTCPSPTEGLSIGLKVTIGVCTGIGGLLLFIIFIYRRRCSSLCCSTVSLLKSKFKTPTNVEVFLESVGCIGLQTYKYSEIKKITNSFKELLGQGGFGSVYKGRLQDGRLVAIKVLNELKGNGEDFINEVATIGKTNHINVVSLLGFCCSGTKRALVYEFMPNGSLENFIYDQENASITNPHLGWEKLYKIALGIAKGLNYLHHECNTRILHFDIKPHNILLDQDFCPKITDFGLAKLCPKRESVISMTGIRGTRGYIAPEVGNPNFRRASHKSDVYSYGMMVLEMLGGRKNMDLNRENLSEIYFPLWIYNHFQQQDMNMDDCEDMYKEETTRKMIIVALWCIQMQPTDRPSISEVIEMLEGNIEELKMPPNPFQNPTSISPP